MHDKDRTANLLGAAALALSDLLVAGVTRAAGVSASGAAALVTLSDFPGLSVTELGRRVGLSQSASARMVDSLEAGGLVERHPRAGREVTVHLTRRGTQATRRLLAARGSPLADVIAGLEEADQHALARLLPRLLARLYEHVGDAELMCRLCDRASCMAAAPCPVGAAERERRR
jgi:MarR family transcriptional regulator, negative regulator of the multidrug operon emrRAB